MSAAYTPKGIQREDLLALKKDAFLKFHLRPGVLFRNVMAIQNFRHLKFLVRRFFHWIIMKDSQTSEYILAPSKETAPNENETGDVKQACMRIRLPS